MGIQYWNTHWVWYIYFSYEECEVKMSKKRPLWMVWHNPDPLADLALTTYTILFKNGDGNVWLSLSHILIRWRTLLLSVYKFAAIKLMWMFPCPVHHYVSWNLFFEIINWCINSLQMYICIHIGAPFCKSNLAKLKHAHTFKPCI